jgi:hypothetical protein
MANKTPYNVKKIMCTWGPHTMEGWFDGTFLEVEADEDGTVKHVGADGRATVALSCNKGAQITITLAQSSASNDFLSDNMPDSDKNSLPCYEFQAKDLNGNSVVHAEVCWIKKVAKVEYGEEVLARKWMLDTERCKFVIKGEAVAA